MHGPHVCREKATALFGQIGRTAEGGGYSNVMKQRDTPEEEAMCREAMESCRVGAIFCDGDQFDGLAQPPMSSTGLMAPEDPIRLERSSLMIADVDQGRGAPQPESDVAFHSRHPS